MTLLILEVYFRHCGFQLGSFTHDPMSYFHPSSFISSPVCLISNPTRFISNPLSYFQPKAYISKHTLSIPHLFPTQFVYFLPISFIPDRICFISSQTFLFPTPFPLISNSVLNHSHNILSASVRQFWQTLRQFSSATRFL